MGPVIKTYGGYKPKRRGLPKFVMETLETTGNAFSALHIDNLKAIRGDNCKPKTLKVTKATAGRGVQPTFDDSLDSTFDKILKSDKNKLSNEACLPVDPKTGMDSGIRCWTCGCVPTTNMAHHVLFECKEDSYYSSPSPRTKKAVARKVKQGVDKAKRRRRLKLQQLPPKKILNGESRVKESPKKPPHTSVRGLTPPALLTDIAAPKFLVEHTFISPVKSPFKTPLCKGLSLNKKLSVFLTSTPDVSDKRPKFSIQTSPILVQLSRDKIDVTDLSVHLVKNTNCNGQQHVKDTSNVLTKSPEVCNKQLFDKESKMSGEPEDSAHVVDEQNAVEEICRVHPLCVDNVQNEQQDRRSRITLDMSKSLDLIETSIVEPHYRPSGYITKRRMWRRTRRTAFNFSVDMFQSNTKSILDDKSAVADASSVVDNLKALTSRNDSSFHYEKEQVNSQQQFSICLDIKEAVKSVSNGQRSCVLESSMECADNSGVGGVSERVDSVTGEHFDLGINELSRELKVCLTLLSPEDEVKDLAYSNYGSDVDMFSDLSIQLPKSHLPSSKSNVPSFEEQMCAIPAFKPINPEVSQFTGPVSSSLTKLTSSSIMDTSIESLSVKKSSENQVDAESLRGVLLSHEQSVAEKLSCRIAPTASKSLNVDASLRTHSPSFDNISKDSASFEVVLKPCFVKLHRYDTHTIADVTYASHCDVSFSEDETDIMVRHKLNEMSHSSNCNAKNNDSFNTVVELPLSLLGKLDKITIRGSSKIRQSSFDSVIQNGRLLERSIAELAEKQIEDAEAAKSCHEINKDSSEDFREVLSRCGQTEPLPFIECYPESMLPMCKKIGEGAYGEVFLHESDKQKTVIKIIPIEGDIEINAAVQKKFWEIKPEIIVAQELSALRKLKSGQNSCDIFNEVLAVRCVRGKYPQWMLDLWHDFDEEKGSENDCPDVFGDDQLFIILELAHGGQDLESYEFTSAEQAVASITQIAFALAVGESEIEFEHRDLHWGNVLIAPTKAKAVQFTLAGEKYKVNTKGVKVSVIDFTMSRMTMPGNGGNMFYDFGHDEELFAAQGDYQCDIYRLMRERTRNNWSVYEPFTNILWLHYLLDKMCSMVAYRNQTTKTHQQAMVKLETMRDRVLAYSSATTFSKSEFFKSSKVR